MAGENNLEEGSLSGQPNRIKITIACFFILGFLVLLYRKILDIATQDVLTGSDIPSSTVVLVGALPALAAKLVFPWFAKGCSYLIITIAVVLLQIGGMLTVVLSSVVEWRLVGIAIVVAGNGLGEITVLALTSFYENVTTSAFAAGSGMGSLLGPFCYTAMTTWACVAPRTAIASTIPLSLLILGFFVLLPKDHLPERKKSEIKYEGRNYSPLDSSEDNEEPLVELNNELSWTGMFSVASEIYPLVSFQFLVYYTSYLAMNAVITTLTFPDAPFSPRDHYQYYTLIHQMGKLFGRSYILMASCACPNAVPYIRVRKTWILALIELLHLLLLVTASWFLLFSSVWIVVILCFTAGFTVGSMYVESAHAVREEFSDPRRREFALSLLMVGTEIGILSAGFMGIYVEPKLKARCHNSYDKENYCLTRYESAASWYSSKKCK